MFGYEFEVILFINSEIIRLRVSGRKTNQEKTNPPKLVS